MDPTARFSALTVVRRGRPLVIYNPKHSAAPQAYNVVHELRHILREHPPGDRVRGLSRVGRSLREEADWLSGALLVSRDGAFMLVRRGGTL